MTLTTLPPVAATPGQQVGPARPSGLARAGIVLTYVGVFLVAVPLLAWSFGARADDLLSLPSIAPEHRAPFFLLGVLGAAWMSWSMLELSVRGRGLPISHLPPVRLVASGPYGVMRHPIYAGFLVALGGFGAASGSAGRAFIASGVVGLAIVDYVVGYEAGGLDGRFVDRTRQHPTVMHKISGSILRRGWLAVRPPVERLANAVILTRRGPTIWVNYGLFVAVGGVLGLSLTTAVLGGSGVPAPAIARYLAFITVGVALGGRVGWLLTAASRRVKGVRRRTVGFVSWGSYVGYLVANLIGAWSLGVGYWWLTDRTLVPALVASAIGRLGCLTYGCCYGRTCNDGIRWTHPEAKVVREQGVDIGSLPRVPCQVLSCSATLVACAAAVACSITRPAEGVVTGALMLLYGMSRFAVDSYRDPVFRGGRRFASGQMYSLVLIALAFALILSANPESSGFDRPLYHVDLSAVLALAPMMVLLGAAGFVAAGYHRGRVGRW